jgi:ABC-2 type transport system permease protein
MRSLLALIALETKLLLREPALLVFTVLLPVGLMLVFGFGFRGEPSPAAGGQRAQPAYVPALSLMISVGMLGFFAIPSVLGTYREKGILPVPQNVPGFVVAVGLGLSALFALGLVVAALAPSGRVAGSVGPLLFFPLLFLAGTWLPRDRMPDWLAIIGAYSPLGALLDTVTASWDGAAPALAQLGVLAAFAVVLGIVAARLFRWECVRR